MQVDVNWLAVVAAALSSMLVGALWYSKTGFGKMWMKLVKLDEKKAEKGAAKAIGLALLVSLVTAYVLAHVIFLSNSFFGNSFLQDALTTSFWVWLGFVAARFVTHDLFEQRPRSLMLLTVSHEFVTLLIMGFIIGIMPPSAMIQG